MGRWMKVSVIAIACLQLLACTSTAGQKQESFYKVTTYDYDSNYYYHQENGYNLNISF